MRSILLLSFVVLLLAAACGGPADEPAAPDAEEAPDTGAAEEVSAGDPDAGKTGYDSLCAACHGPDATGVEGLGRDLTTSEFVGDSSDSEMLEYPGFHQIFFYGDFKRQLRRYCQLYGIEAAIV